jgi:sortase A
MEPNNPNNRRSSTPQIPQRPYLHSPGAHERTVSSQQHHEAAANIARGQLASIYGGNTHTPTPQTTPVAPEKEPATQPQQQEAANPYHRTHSASTNVQADQWKQYHSAWQEYYQKYYERYYVGQVHRARQALETRAADATTTPIVPAAIDQPEPSIEPGEGMSRKQAMNDLRKNLRSRIRSSAKKARGSRHFIPITAAICVMLVFLFLQYNRNIIATVHAYVSPGNIDPANIIVDPTTDLQVSPDPRLIIPKINVDVPVVWNTTPDQASQLKAMESGVAWFGIPGANSKPGQVGNTVLSGHSSNDLLDQGSYKFIFAQLDRLQNGDTIFINYESKRYTYTVTKKEVVAPTDVQALIYDTDKPILTLITCTPVGTAQSRLLVTAEQISPNPGDAKAAPESSSSESAAMPGNSPTFVERLFGA